MKEINEQLYKYCLERTAQAWCKPATENKTMDPDLAEEMAKIMYEEIICLSRIDNPWDDLILVRRGDFEMMRLNLMDQYNGEDENGQFNR